LPYRKGELWGNLLLSWEGKLEGLEEGKTLGEPLLDRQDTWNSKRQKLGRVFSNLSTLANLLIGRLNNWLTISSWLKD